MTVSMRVMSAGNGYQYLLRSVVAGDGNRTLTTPMTRYYSEAGTPPGRWLGSAVRALGAGQILPEMEVTESQLALLIGLGRDPVTGAALGRAYPEFNSLAERIKERVADLDPELTSEDREDETARIEAEEAATGSRRAVAGYDFTFSVPKSVSVLWGVADATTQVRILDAHHAAVTEVLDFLEREVAATRTGVANHNGAVAQVGVAGVAAAAYDHWDSRAGDPQLHTHLVISQKVQTLLDGRWRSLDGRPMHAAVTALSAHYNAVLADHLTRELGLEWERRERGADRNPQWEIAGVGDEVIAEFSGRTRDIEREKDRLIDHYVTAHGRRPSEKTIVRLRAQATLATRPEKELHSLADLSAVWRRRAARLVGGDATKWAGSLTAGRAGAPLRADEVSLAAVGRIAARVVDAVSEKRATWRRWNLWAEASKQTMDVRFASTEDREAIVGLIVEAAEHESISLTPPELAISPDEFRRPDGTSVFRPRHSTVYSSTAVLAAEDRLLARADDRSGPVVPAAVVDRVAGRSMQGHQLSRQQIAALESIATSGRRVDVLVGPAGAGKTTAMRALRAGWMRVHGRGSVVGLAPSAAAAQVLADDLGVACDNTAKWLHEYDRGRAILRRGQLVIVDEASLAGTTTLDRITTIASVAGAKVLLVGDGAQLQSVDAGGAFTLLTSRRSDTPTLTEIHRFTQPWEQAASLELRDGQVEVIDTYARHHRLAEGTTEAMLDAAYDAWLADTRIGKTSVLVTEATAAVHALNSRARAERIVAGDIADGRDVELADDARASVGDLVITRRNDRRLRTPRGAWVHNGDRWNVTDVRADGSMVVRRLGHRWAATTVLPPDYVREHVDLGYAVTAHRAQGMTVDTAHVVVSGSTTRENLYVSMTRGRDSNIAYVTLDQPDDSHTAPEPDQASAHTVLYGVLRHSGVEISAHQTIEAEQNAAASIAQQAAEYETLAAAAQRSRWSELLHDSELTLAQVNDVLTSEAFGPLASELRRAEANGHDVKLLLAGVVAQHSLDDAEDVAAVLRYRLAHAQSTGGRRRECSTHFMAGLIPVALEPMDAEHRTALSQRQHLIETRAQYLAHQAAEAKPAWLRRVGQPPTPARERDRWLASLATVAAYRDRYVVTSAMPLGGKPATDTQRRDRLRAAEALRHARQIAADADPSAFPGHVIDSPTIR